MLYPLSYQGAGRRVGDLWESSAPTAPSEPAGGLRTREKQQNERGRSPARFAEKSYPRRTTSGVALGEAYVFTTVWFPPQPP